MSDTAEGFRALREVRREDGQRLLKDLKRALVDLEEQGAIKTQWLTDNCCRVWNARDESLWADLYATTGTVRFKSGARELPTGLATLLKVLELYPSDTRR